MKVYLRLATKEDMSLILAWRNSPLIWRGFYTQTEPIDWDTHNKWWHSRNQDWRIFIIMLKYEDYSIINERPIGSVNVGQLDHWCPEIGFFIGNPTDWGKGYCKEAVRQVLEWIKEYGREYVHTTILKSNERSIKLLKSLGFEYLGEAREGEIWMQKKL